MTYKGNPIRLLSDFSAKTVLVRKEWDQIFKLLKERNYQQRKMYPENLSFRYEREIKIHPDIQKLMEFFTIRPALQKILNGVILMETKRQNDTKI